MGIGELKNEELSELLTRQEELHPDLKPYFFEAHQDPLARLPWPTIKHPLVYSVPHFVPNALVNKQYEVRKAHFDECIRNKNWDGAIQITERPWRLQTFQDCMTHMSDRDYWELLRECWGDSENIWQHKDEWKRLLRSKRKGFGQHFMCKEERDFLKALPAQVTVHRGCIAGQNEYGMSWTLDHDKAVWFSKRFQHADESPCVLTRTIPKSQIKAYIGSRNESEILLLNPPV